MILLYAVFAALTHYFWDQVSGVKKTFEANVSASSRTE